MKFKQITIIGVGLIGGSIGLAIKKRRLADQVIGVTRHRGTLSKAIRRGAIDKGTLDPKRAVDGSDLVILATPVDKTLGTLQNIASYLKPGCIVTDVGSIKDEIVRRAELVVGKKYRFVGCHPMAGSEKRGIDKANAQLFKGAACLLTVTAKTDARALRTMHNLWKAFGSRLTILSPIGHDEKISNISHLPHVAASALCLTARPSSMQFAAGGFRDTTRIASSSPDLWVPILLSNGDNVAKDIDRYITQLKNIRQQISRRDRSGLRRSLLNAKVKRDRHSSRWGRD